MAALMAFAGLARGDTPSLTAVGDAGNAADATGYGAVGYAYRIGVHEVTRGEYAAFLNAVAATDSHGLYNPNMGIARSGSPGGYTYAAAEGARSVAYVSWYDAARYVNWLHNGQPSGAQGAAGTENGAYAFSGETVAGSRTAGARYFLPTEDEWYKAAYYQGGADAFYWKYPTRSDEPPVAAAPPSGDNAANYEHAAGTTTAAQAYPATSGYYGTYDQAGNLWEWNETAVDGDRGLRGGSYDDYHLLLQSWYRDSQDPARENEFVGFRVAAVATALPPPTYGLAVASGSGDGSYEAGTVVPIAADPAPAGQEFDRWTGDVAAVADPLAAATTVTMPAGAVSVAATYKLKAVIPFDMTVAEWTSSTSILWVGGKGPAGQTVRVTNSSGRLVGTVVIAADGTWALRTRVPRWNVPKWVRATCNGVTDQMTVIKK